MAVVYLLSAAEFKAYTPVHGNVDDKFLQQSILACQDMYVIEITGTDLYNYLVANVASLGANYKTLLQDYIHKGMRYWIMAELGAILSRRFTNVGYQDKHTENSGTVDRENLVSDYGNLMNKAEYFADRTRKYLCANTSLFPEYLTTGSDEDDVQPKNNLFKSSIYLGGHRKLPNFPRLDDDCCD